MLFTDVQPTAQKWAIYVSIKLLLALVIGMSWLNLYATKQNTAFKSWLNKKEAMLRHLG